MTDQTLLGTPLTVRNGVVLRNRFMKSATSEQMGDKNRDPRPALPNLYRAWSERGVGLAISGNLMVDRDALGEPFNVVLDDESDLALFRKWTQAATGSGMHFWAQINHPGKQSPNILSPEPVAPSAIPLDSQFDSMFNKPRALEESEIWGLVKKFSRAAKLAKDTGFTGVQIHGAHGYLISQFLSPRHNQRTDQWGGTLENRMRFLMEVYHAVRMQVGEDYPVAIKLNSADFQKDGFSEEDSMSVVQALSDADIDFVEISGGTYERPAMSGVLQEPVKESTAKREAYFLSYAEAVRRVTSVPLGVTGGFRSAESMTYAIESGATDMIGMARPLMLMPDLPLKAQNDPGFSFYFEDPTTGFPSIEQAGALALTWYERQMERIAKSKKPKMKLSAWWTIISMFWGVGMMAFTQRRV